MRISPGVCVFVVTRPSERLGRCDWIVYIMWYEMTQYLPRWRKDFIKKILSEARKILHWRLGERPIHLVTVCLIGLLLVLSSCTGSQEPLQRTKQCTTANQWLRTRDSCSETNKDQWLFPCEPVHQDRILLLQVFNLKFKVWEHKH